MLITSLLRNTSQQALRHPSGPLRFLSSGNQKDPDAIRKIAGATGAFAITGAAFATIFCFDQKKACINGAIIGGGYGFSITSLTLLASAGKTAKPHPTIWIPTALVAMNWFAHSMWD